jgi:hypothetical protein
MTRLLASIGVAAAGFAAFSAGNANADPGSGGTGECQYLGTSYNIYYPCTEYQPWLPYGTANNPPLGGVPQSPQDCSGVRMHNIGCS